MTEAYEISNNVEPDEDEIDEFFIGSQEENEEYYEKLIGDSLSRKSRRNLRSYISSSDSSTRAWNIDKTRQNLLKRLTLLPIGKHSFEVLSKFIINRQILEIVKVLKFGSCIELHVKLNLKKLNMSEHDTYDSVVKIFQHVKNLRPDIEAAKKFKVALDSKGKIDSTANALQEKNYEKAVRTENIIFTKMIGDDELCLLQSLSLNPHDLNQNFEGVLGELMRNRRDHKYDFVKETLPKDMFWYKNQWMVVCTLSYSTLGPKKNEQYFYLVNLYSLAKMFNNHGIENDELLGNFNILKHNNFCYRHDRFRKIRIKAKGGTLEVFSSHTTSCVIYTVASNIDFWRKTLEAIAS